MAGTPRRDVTPRRRTAVQRPSSRRPSSKRPTTRRDAVLRPNAQARPGSPRPAAPGRRPAGRPGSGPASVDRRTLFKGAAVLGAAGAVIGTVGSVQGCSSSSDQGADGAPTVVDDNAAVSVIDTYTSQDSAPGLTQTGSWTLPLGTVLGVGEGDWIPCTLTGDSANPVVSAGAFSLSGGKAVTVVDQPRSQGSTYVVYAVACSDSVYAWVELDTLSSEWHLYGSAFSAGALTGDAVELASGDADWDAPLMACSGDAVLWLTMPSTGGTKTTESSTCNLWRVGQSEAKAVVTSKGRFACGPTVSQGVVTLVPRVREDEGVYYGITAYELSDDLASSIDQLVLPVSVKPFSAVRMGENFAFQIEANYSSGGLLGQMGTYVSQGDDKFVTVSREPVAAPAGKGDVLIVKVRSSYLVSNSADSTYGMLTAEDRSLDYGEYPARVGTCDTFVTYATVKDATTGYPASVTVRAFSVA